MPTGFPGGITSPDVGSGWTAVPGKVFYVSNRTGLPSSNGLDPSHPFASVNAALAKCQANRGDGIRILPGHVDPVAAASAWSSLVAGVTIEGFGRGDQRGIVRWSAADATVLLNKAGVCIRNLRMQWAGDPAATTALTVAAPITITGTGTTLLDIDVDCGVDADQIVTVGCTVNAAGCRLERVVAHGAAAAEITATGTVIRLVAADRCVIKDCYISAALATDTDGVIETLTTASLDLDISDNYLYANGAGNTCALDMGAALACTGRLKSNLMVVDADATAQTVVFTRNAANNMALMDNNLVNDNNERGLVIGTASA